MAAPQSFMDRALDEARLAGSRGEIPVGAVIVVDNAIIASAGNRTREKNDPTAHAEVEAIRAAGFMLGSDRLPGADLYVTLEPCTLCAAAISFARIRRLYYGTEDVKGGGVDNGVRFYQAATCHHAPDVYSGFAAQESAAILRDFFGQKR